MSISARGISACIAACIAGLVVGYFAGREHVKYELRNILASTTASFQAGGGADVRPAAPIPPPVPVSTTSPPLEAPKKAPPIAISLVNKGFKARDIHADDFEDDVTFSLSIKNLTEKDIRAFDGTLTFTDLLDNEIISLNLAINDSVSAGDTMNWKGGMKYNQFVDADQRLRNASLANIKIVFAAHKVLFVDGTTVIYDGM